MTGSGANDEGSLEAQIARLFFVAVAYVGTPLSLLWFASELLLETLTLPRSIMAALAPAALLAYSLGPSTLTYRSAIATTAILALASILLLVSDPTFGPASIFVAAFVTYGLGIVLLSTVLSTKRTDLPRAARTLSVADEGGQTGEEPQATVAGAQRLESLGRIAAGVAHEFNNTLAIVLSNAEELKRDGVSPNDLKERAQRIIDASRTAQSVARRLVAFTQSTSDVARSSTPGAELKDLVRLWQSTRADLNEVTLTGSSEGVVRLSPHQLERMVLSLLLNAQDAIGESPGRIEIAINDVDDPHLGVELVVRDNGYGMDAETLSRAFEPLFTTKAPRDGTGLGLAVVQSLVTEAGGEVSISSTPRVETTVRIFLPRIDDRKTSPDQTLSGGALLVEDEPDVREALARLLARVGFEVSTFASADEAIRQMPSDLVLLCTDAVMPGRGVTELIDAFRRSNPSGRVLVCSGHASSVLEERGLREPDVSFMTKPFTRQQLVTRLRTLLPS